jgi:tryptophan synthase beta subunit
LKELGGQYVRKDILINVVQLEAPIEQVKQEQSFLQSDNNNLNYDNRRRESQGW